MMIFKWIGALLVIVGCGGAGVAMAAAYRREERELRRLTAGLDYIACELQYHLTPLPDLCRQAGSEIGGAAGKGLVSLSTELESMVHPDVESSMVDALCHCPEISGRVKEAFLLLGCCLGRFDTEGQLQGLSAVRDHCRRELETMSSGKENRLRSFQTLGICAGAALAILFI